MTVSEFCLIKPLPYILSEKKLHFSIGNGQPRETALCQLYRHTFVPCCSLVVREKSACVKMCCGSVVCERCETYREVGQLHIIIIIIIVVVDRLPVAESQAHNDCRSKWLSAKYLTNIAQ